MYLVFLISVLVMFGALGGVVWALCEASAQPAPSPMGDDAE